MNPTKITVSSCNLFQIAATYCNSALLWYQIAQINNLPADPVLTGTYTLTLPPPDSSGGNGGILYQ